MRNPVSILGCESYDPALLDAAIETHFQNLELDSLLQRDTKIFLKPNLLMKRSPEDATTTHPQVVGAIVRALKRRGCKNILLGDSCGGPYIASLLKSVYQGTGMDAMAEQEGFALNYNTGFREVVKLQNLRCKTFNIIEPALDAGLIINIAKLKTHAMTGMSAATKNIFGCVPGLQKPELHCRFPKEADFGEMLIDLCETVRPQISFIDAIMCMEGNGPSGGNPRFVGALLASHNPYDLDLAASKMIAMRPEKIPYLQNAIDRQLCPLDLENLRLVGDSLASFVVPDFQQPDTSRGTDFITRLPKFMQKPAAALTSPKPVIRTGKCIGCGKCKESCPQSTITIAGRKAMIEYGKCIRCYCCHEMCPVRAIDIKRFKLFNV